MYCFNFSYNIIQLSNDLYIVSTILRYAAYKFKIRVKMQGALFAASTPLHLHENQIKVFCLFYTIFLMDCVISLGISWLFDIKSIIHAVCMEIDFSSQKHMSESLFLAGTCF